MHDFLEQHIVDKPSFIEIDMESQAQYAVSRFYATSELPAVELQTKPRQGLFAKEAYGATGTAFIRSDDYLKGKFRDMQSNFIRWIAGLSENNRERLANNITKGETNEKK